MAHQPEPGVRRLPWVPVVVGLALLAVLGLVLVLGSAIFRVSPRPNPTALPSAGSSGPASPTATGATAPTVAPTAPRSAGPPHTGASTLIARPRTAGSWPGQNGLSGVNGDPVFDTAHVQQFCTARGRACQVAQTYTDRRSYQSMTSGTGWTFENMAGFPGMLIVSQGLVPEGHPEDLAGCAAGQFDQLWREFGMLMVRYGRGDSVVRLGWEFNGNFMAWHASDATTWIACYRKAADGIRATNPAVLFDWTINGHDTPDDICGGVSTNCYPGDDYVDIVGIDNYDHFPAAGTLADFDRINAAPEGLDWLYAFARQHRKLFAVGEWGVVHNSDGGGDSAGFIRWMHDWFAEHATGLAYEAYFSDCAAGQVQSSLFRTDTGCLTNPAAASAYRSLFGQ